MIKDNCISQFKSSSIWKDPIFIFCMVFIAIVSILFIYAKSLLILLFITGLLFILLDPLVNRLSSMVSHGAAVLIALGSFFGVLLMLLSLIFRSVLPDLSAFAREFPNLVIQFDTATVLSTLPPEFMEYGNQLLHNTATYAVNIVKESIVPLIRTFSGVAEMIAVPFLTFYLLKDGRKITAAIAGLLPPAQVTRFAPFFSDIGMVLSGYIRGQMLIAIFSGVIVFVGMLTFGLPYAHILALVSAFSEFVPVIGTVIATVPGTLVGLSFSPVVAVKVLLFYIVLLKVNHNIIYPKIVGEAIKVHPLFIMVAILLFGHLFGVIGMLFAVPTVAVSRVCLLHLLGHR